MTYLSSSPFHLLNCSVLSFSHSGSGSRIAQVERELLRLSQLLDMSKSTTEDGNAELLDRMAT